MVEMTLQETIDIDEDRKILTIRKFTKKGHMPFKVGTKTYLKIGRNKNRYGQIQFTEAIVKPLTEMTDRDALDGGYTCRDDYINDHMTKFNSDCDLEEPMIFYRFKKLWMDAELVNGLRRKAETEKGEMQ